MMKRLNLGLLYALLSIRIVCAREYLYPVASVKRESGQYKIYLMHQISSKRAELLEWDPESKVVTQALTTFTAPCGIKILPDNSGYSFIDQGQLYLKLFFKRSAQKIDISEPLYNIEVVEWIDQNLCYFSAKSHEQIKIYLLSRFGNLHILAQSDNADCMYPQKIDSTVFYIERSFNKKKYSIRAIPYWPDLPATHESQEAHTPCAQTIFQSGDQAIAFLHMTSITQGFFIGYPDTIHTKNTQTDCLTLSYNKISYDNMHDLWISEKLFDFSVPLDLILPHSKYRLYESLLPLLPRHTPSGIYYCDCSDRSKELKVGYRNHGGTWYEAQPIKMYFYSFDTKTTSIETSASESFDVLAPLIVENKLLYGHSVATLSHNSLPSGMWRNTQGQVCYEIPHGATIKQSHKIISI